jgi:GDP-mannose 6-dehydrogenase
MRIAVFGLGYVGCVSGACLAEMGHKVVGVDVNQVKVDLVNEGKPTVIEKDFTELMKRVSGSGSFSATTNGSDALKETDIAFICVGTPSRSNGSIDLKYVKQISEEIGKNLAKIDWYYVVCVRSTVFPGSVEGVVIPALEEFSGKKAGVDFGVCMVPEFLREGSSVQDFYDPPKTVIGQFNPQSGQLVADLFKDIDAPLLRTDLKVAEMVKYADNAFHALKVAFANEIGNVCKVLEFDSHRVMEIFCMDTKLNLSPYYLKPGFAFGGSCLPKDLRAINYESKTLDMTTPVLASILESNRLQIHKVIAKLLEYKGANLGFLGLSFKGGTDDLRESPIVEVIEAMIGKGLQLKIYDQLVSIARLVGSNKEYIEKEIPHISSLLCSTAQELIRTSDVVIISQASDEFRKALSEGLNEKHIVIDLVRIFEDSSEIPGEYYGICW